MKDKEPEDVWEGDLLGFKSVGEAFTRLIKTIDDTKVISIEAGYGRGKTFFRERWAKHLEASGEVVIQIDAHMADHTGDPVLTFVGALIDKLPESDTPKRDAAFAKGKKVLGVLARTAGGIAARQGAGALVDYLSDEMSEGLEGQESLQEHLDAFSDGVSKKAGNLIAAQIEAERVRNIDLPEQMKALRAALTGEDPEKEKPEKRVVVLVDELDRCHPDYAIAFLEAMKLVFAHDGFVFCLMVNAHYLEGLAANRFGQPEDGERYLDKFVDIRLALPLTDEVFSEAVEQLFRELPEGIPFGEGPEFTLARASALAGALAVRSKMSMRQIKRVRLKIELALRCYADRPFDVPLLVGIAFINSGRVVEAMLWELLPRARLTPQVAERFQTDVNNGKAQFGRYDAASSFVHEHCQALVGLPEDRYECPEGRNMRDWAKICLFLGPRYIPDHEAALNTLAQFDVRPNEGRA
ncbi:P-loop NTPase fold protein [Leisingera sp. SS27]|uniref:KAP family P-loop NTPase fold protein n=1 Tax=Leisingera sp. SS27 TaxID=2979462 RepID=UPI00232C511E|nr:P-loop NTPase fold protein [Leisingera sp. SS27]MDC0657729.1 P-loop NTPase fold protein [Leisingera sp. SS27]